jgi:FKBP-type peptidyl-prolyl cis-trans isomerase FkpA
MIKKLAYTVLASALLLGLSGCDLDNTAKASNASSAETAKPAAAAESADSLTFQEKTAIAVGSSYGENLAKGIDQAKEFGFDLDKNLLAKAFADALSGKSQMSTDEAQQVLQEFDNQMRTKAAEKQKADAEVAKKAGEEYLANNAKKEGVVTTASGLQYEILTAGTGAKPTATDIVRVNYKGTTIDGVVFDESKEPVEFPLDKVIKGWTEGLQLLNVGSKARLVVPSALAYGEFSPTDKIKPNSVLVFDVELLDIVQKAPAAEAPKAEKSAPKEAK